MREYLTSIIDDTLNVLKKTVNQGLATLAFFGVGVNLVLFLTRVLGQDNASAANNVSKWTGTVYIFSLLGAFLSDSYWGRYKTCAIFQAVFVVVSSSSSSSSLSVHLVVFHSPISMAYSIVLGPFRVCF